MKTGLMLMLLLVLCWWFFLKSTDTTKPLTKPNIISRVDHPVVNNDQQASEKPRANKSPVSATERTTATAITTHSQQNSQSYLQLYRDFKFSEDCGGIFNTLSRNGASYDFLQHYIERFAPRSADQLNQPSAIQIEGYETFITDCLKLEDKYNLFVQSTETTKSHKTDKVTAYLAEQLLTAKTSSTKEKNLQKLRQISDSWDEEWQVLVELSGGQLAEEDPAIMALQQQIADLKNTRRQQRQLLGAAYTQDMTMAYIRQYQELQRLLTAKLQFDRPGRRKAMQQVQETADQIRQYLYLKDADLFYEAASLLGDQRGYRVFNSKTANRHFKGALLDRMAIPYVSEAKQLQQITGHISSRNFMVVSSYANHLLLCTLGEDCGPSSTLMRNYCLGVNQMKSHLKACQKDLASFYFEDYLSPNQRSDVAAMYDQLVSIYGL